MALDFWFSLYSFPFSHQLGLSKLSSTCILHCLHYTLLYTTENDANEGPRWSQALDSCVSHMGTTGGAESWVDGEAGKGKDLAKGDSWKIIHVRMCKRHWASEWKSGHLSPLCHFLAVGFREVHLASLSLSLLICKVITIKPTSQGYCEDLRKRIC